MPSRHRERHGIDNAWHLTRSSQNARRFEIGRLARPTPHRGARTRHRRLNRRRRLCLPILIRAPTKNAPGSCARTGGVTASRNLDGIGDAQHECGLPAARSRRVAQLPQRVLPPTPDRARLCQSAAVRAAQRQLHEPRAPARSFNFTRQTHRRRHACGRERPRRSRRWPTMRCTAASEQYPARAEQHRPPRRQRAPEPRCVPMPASTLTLTRVVGKPRAFPMLKALAEQAMRRFDVQIDVAARSRQPRDRPPQSTRTALASTRSRRCCAAGRTRRSRRTAGECTPVAAIGSARVQAHVARRQCKRGRLLVQHLGCPAVAHRDTACVLASLRAQGAPKRRLRRTWGPTRLTRHRTHHARGHHERLTKLNAEKVRSTRTPISDSTRSRFARYPRIANDAAIIVRSARTRATPESLPRSDARM